MYIFFFWGGGGSLQNWDYFWGHFYTFFFLRSRYRLEISFGVAIISDILGGGGGGGYA